MTAPIPKQKKYFDIRVESMLPATITYRVFAEDEQEAMELMKRAHPTSIKHNLAKKRDIKAVVFDAGTTLIRFTKTFLR